MKNKKIISSVIIVSLLTGTSTFAFGSVMTSSSTLSMNDNHMNKDIKRMENMKDKINAGYGRSVYVDPSVKDNSNIGADIEENTVNTKLLKLKGQLEKEYKQLQFANSTEKKAIFKKIRNLKKQLKTISIEMKNEMEHKYGELKKIREKYKNNIKKERHSLKERAEAMKKRFQEEHSKLSTEVREEMKKNMKKIKAKFQEQMKSLYNEYRNVKTKEDKNAIKKKILELKKEIKAEVIKANSNNPVAVKYIKEKHEQMNKIREERQAKMNELKKMKNEKQKQMRNKIKETRKIFKETKQEMIVKYKEVIYKRFSKKLDRFNLKRLEKIQTKIDKTIKKFENLKMSEEKKTKILAILEAVKEVVNKKIEDKKVKSNNINEDEILNSLFK